MKSIDRLKLLPERSKTDTTGWSKQHIDAIENPKEGIETATIDLIRAWLQYADAHEARFNKPIGADYVIGRHWERIGADIRGLLNSDLGQLDPGTLDEVICRALTEQGLTESL